MIKHNNWGFSTGKNPTKLDINSFSEYCPSINFFDVPVFPATFHPATLANFPLPFSTV